MFQWVRGGSWGLFCFCWEPLLAADAAAPIPNQPPRERYLAASDSFCSPTGIRPSGTPVALVCKKGPRSSSSEKRVCTPWQIDKLRQFGSQSDIVGVAVSALD